MVGRGAGRAIKGIEDTSGGDGHIHYLNCGHDFMGYTCAKTSIYTLSMCSYCTSIIPE